MSKAFTAEFKLETAKLVLDQHYTHEDAAKAMNVSRSAISRWVRTLRLERQGKTSPGLPLPPEHSEFRAMKKRIQRLEVVDKLRARYSVASLCQMFDVHRSSYRQWHCRADAPDTERVIKRSLVKEASRPSSPIHTGSRWAVGWPAS